MTKYVYHSSKVQNLKKLKPNKSTHKEPWVYATRTLEMSAVFLSRIGGDFSCQVGIDPETNKVYICERFKNAFEYRYANKSGSIYLLSNEGFITEKTGWSEEVVNENEVEVVDEIIIEDVLKYLLKLHNDKKIIIVRYPNKIDSIPEDNEDLVMRGIVWTREFGDTTLTQIKKYHPELLERIKNGLNDGKYLKIE